MRSLFLIILLLSSLSASAGQWYQDEAIAESRPDIGSSNGFGAMIIMTTDSQEALRNWAQPTRGVYLPRSETVEKGRPMEALIVFSGCRPNDKGNCVVAADYKILKPDGSLYAKYEDTEVWRNKPVIPAGRVGLAVDRVGLIADPDDPIGEYKIHCTVRDTIANSEFTISAGFVVVEASKKPHPTADAPVE
ncbi:MAG: hypothetical protein P1U67_02670 [Alcanivoracaceae bacterium]|nr:hypothetical protein [Alcanivoracaceae bacterium]